MFQSLSCTGQGVQIHQPGDEEINEQCSICSQLFEGQKDRVPKSSLYDQFQTVQQGKAAIKHNLEGSGWTWLFSFFFLNNLWKDSEALEQVIQKGSGVSHLEVFKTWLEK